METGQHYNYHLVEKAIGYINDNFKQKPSLEEIASHVKLSPYHFQEIFTDWAGVSPKKFVQYLSINYTKRLLNKKESATLFNKALETGILGASQLHDLSIKTERMTPEEYKNGGEALNINYSLASGYFGEVLIASTPKGICYLSFFDEEILGLKLLRDRFPAANFTQRLDDFQQSVIEILQNDFTDPNSVMLHLKGTDFQLKVWEALSNIPFGDLSTYGKIASKVGSPNAARAVGTAIGSNPIAFIIPCHRVIQNSGKLGGYMWGLNRKRMILGWEAAKVNDFL